MIQDVIDNARDFGYRDVADTMEMILDRVDDPRKEIDDIDPRDYPVDEETAMVFYFGMIFGVLVDRNEHPDIEDEIDPSIAEHVLRREAVIVEDQVVVPTVNGFAELSTETREVRDELSFECSCGETFNDRDDAKLHFREAQ